VAAVAAVIGLIGLFWYVRETRRLRQISNRQAEIAAQQIESLAKPCVLIMEDADQLRAFQDRNLILKNVGTGPALNIRWRLRTWSSDMATAPALGPTGFIRPALKPPDIDASGGAECTFTSLGGRSYRSTSKYVRVPLGLPAGLPDCPGRNRDFDGGFPYPTSPSLVVIAVIAHNFFP